MNFEKQVKLFDIEDYDGPMLSLFRDDKADSFYLYKWLDVEPNGHKWLIFKTNLDNLYDYIHQNIDEKTLIKKALGGQYTTVVIQPNLVYAAVKRFTSASLPNSFLPANDYFFTQSDCPDYTKVMAFFDNISVVSLQLANKAA
jgi:hypothetical protein